MAPLQVKRLWADNNAIEKAKSRGYQLYVSSEEGDANGSSSTLNGNQFSYVVDTSVATALDLPLYEEQGFQNLGLYIHDSIFMGPYYTGRIVLNNIQVEGNYGNVNITPLPYAGTVTQVAVDDYASAGDVL